MILETIQNNSVYFTIDVMLDFLPMQDLIRMIGVSKFFGYMATLEKLYVKFGFSESDITGQNSM